MRKPRAWTKCFLAGALSVAAAGTALVAVGQATAGSTTVPYKLIERYVTLAGGTTRSIDTTCPAGMRPVGGGAHYGTGGWNALAPPYAQITQSDIDTSRHGWEVTLILANGQSRSSFTVDTICTSL